MPNRAQNKIKQREISNKMLIFPDIIENPAMFILLPSLLLTLQKIAISGFNSIR
ncbi:hypothetical protein THF5H11_90072 [Vibrio jasicida]|nr:hypothetical protein THF5H11_90072 [Vibrio jasicida]CAH1605232.1 hypothetical protein THF5G08_120097 [Vibrio jasicida]